MSRHQFKLSRHHSQRHRPRTKAGGILYWEAAEIRERMKVRVLKKADVVQAQNGQVK